MVSVASVSSGKQGVAGCTTGRCLHVVSEERTAVSSQFVNIRGVNVINTEGFEFRAKVVDTNEQYIRFVCGRKCSTEKDQA